MRVRQNTIADFGLSKSRMRPSASIFCARADDVGDLPDARHLPAARFSCAIVTLAGILRCRPAIA